MTIFGIAAAVGTIKDWEVYTLLLCAWCVFVCEEHQCRHAHALGVALQVRAESSSNGAQHNGSGEYDFDLFTIGAGSGGVRAARWAASNYGACHSSPHRSSQETGRNAYFKQSFTDWQALSLYVSLQMPQISDSLSAGVKQVCLGVSAVHLSCRHQGSGL